MTSLKPLVLALCLIPWDGVLAAPVPGKALQFLAGDWCALEGSEQFEERWTSADGDHLFAISRSFRGRELSGFEFLRIERQAQGWVYLAQPGGGATVPFTLTDSADDHLVFANPAHDFPQRIEYWRDPVGLHATISSDGGERRTFDFRAGRCSPGGAPPPSAPARTMAEVLDATTAADWRQPDPQRTLYLDLPGGRVVIELAPAFAPKHAANILELVRSGYYDGLAILRVQDNFVVQWGDPQAEDEQARKQLGAGVRELPAEFTRPATRDLAFTPLPDSDGYAPQTGFVDGFPAALDATSGRAWMTHCYGTLGVGRDNDVNSGGGTELYVVIGHAPRQLDRNITVVGRVLQGMELLSSLPRGTGPLGFYELAEQRVPIKTVRVAADMPVSERSSIEVLRTDTESFRALVEARRNRSDAWYKQPAGHIDVCSVPLPVRARH
jgi:peptidylprolyl isomerase